MDQQHHHSCQECATVPLLPKATEAIWHATRGSFPKYYRCTIESVLTGCITAWYGKYSIYDRKALQWVVKTAQYILGTVLLPITDIHCKYWTVNCGFLYYTYAKMFILSYWAIYCMCVFVSFIISYCCCIVEKEPASNRLVGRCMCILWLIKLNLKMCFLWIRIIPIRCGACSISVKCVLVFGSWNGVMRRTLSPFSCISLSLSTAATLPCALCYHSNR